MNKFLIDVSLDETNIDNFGDVIIESDVWVGDGAKILKGVLLGKGCIIGAGCVVVKSTEPYDIYVGVPARKVGM